nr:hypothetical protein [Tanacetum cinerariifolium]
MEQELCLKREAAERAFEAQAEKDRTLMRLEELRFLATSTKDLDDDDAYWIKKQKRLIKNKMRNDLDDEDDEDEGPGSCEKKGFTKVGITCAPGGVKDSICYLFFSLHQLVSRAEVPVKMPPRRNKPLTEAYEQEFEQRIMERMDERLGQFVDQLTDQMNALMNNRRPHNRRREDEDEESEENPFGDGSSFDEQSVVRPRRNQREDNRHWESGIRVNISDFDGDTLNPERFIDWLAAVEEVVEKKRVSLIATKLRGRASAWWQQMKLTRERVGKSKITSWQKMKKCMMANFIPHNYQRLMYQRLQNLKQGSKSVEDYTTEFYQLIARNDIQEREYQLVSRYIGVSGSGNTVSRFSPNQAKAGGGNTGPVPKATGSSGLKCFKCGEPSHRQSECKKAGKRYLFADPENNDDDVAYGDYEAASFYDEEPEYEEEYVSEDVGVNLVVRRSCLTPKADGDDWLKHNIFQSTCTILGKVCTFVCDSGRCDNLIAEEAVQKLGLKTENRPKPYKLQWRKKGGEVTVSKRVHVPFLIGTTYKDNVWCDVVAMDACHLLLGRPWEYDRDITHNGKTNTYSFVFGGVKITLMPNKPDEVVNKPTGTLLTLSQFEDELEMGDDIFVLIGKEVAEDSEVPEAMIPLLEEFIDVFLDELPDGLPPLMSPGEHEELRRHVEELISKGHVRESMSPCVVPTLLTQKKDGTWRMCVDSRSIKITVRYRFLIPRLDDLLDQISGATIFTKLDLKSGYYQIRLRPGDEWKTAFKTREGLYEWLVMPFGLSNAPSLDLDSEGQFLSSHEEVLTLLRKDNFYPATKKCVFMTHKVLFLGYVVSGDGIRVDESKVAVVQEWLTPTTIMEVRSFHELAFQVVKEKLTTTPILVLPDFSKVFELHTDASKVAIGGALSQGGRHVAYFSEKLIEQKSRHICTQYKVSHKHGRWLVFLEKFTFVVKHKTGVSNRAANALSKMNGFLVTIQVDVPGLDVIRDMVTLDPYFLVVLQGVQSREKIDFVLHDGFLFKGNQLFIPIQVSACKLLRSCTVKGMLAVIALYSWFKLLIFGLLRGRKWIVMSRGVVFAKFQRAQLLMRDFVKENQEKDKIGSKPDKNGKPPVCHDDDDDEERSDSLNDNIISGLPSFSAITPDEPALSTEEPDNSLSMRDEHLDTIPATESDEFIKSGVKTLIPIPSESEGIPEHMCDVSSHDNSPPLDVSKDQIEDFSESNEEFSSTDNDSFSFDNIDYVEASPPDSELVSSEVMEIVIPKVGGIKASNDNPICSYDPIIPGTPPNLTPSGEKETHNFDNSLPEFTTFSKVLVDAECESDSNDDQSSSDEDEEIIPMKSLRTYDSSLSISSKIDSLLDEFAGELTLLKSIPRGIGETDCDFGEDIRLIEKLLYDNSSPRPPEEFVSANSDSKIKSFSPSPILVKYKQSSLGCSSVPFLSPLIHSSMGEFGPPHLTLNKRFMGGTPCLSF